MKTSFRFAVASILVALALAPAPASSTEAPVDPAQAGAKVMATPSVLFDADKYEGSQYRDVVWGTHLARQDAPTRWAQLQPVLDFCDAKKDTDAVVHVSVSTKAEHDELLAGWTDARQAVFIDITCPRAYTQAAYFAAEDGDPAKAIRLLERAQHLAPFLADPYSERGFLHNAAGERELALASYRRSLALAERYPASASEMPLALRGIGWTLVELGDLAGARDAYQRSLVSDPGNATAANELAYIDDLLAKRRPLPATPAFTPATDTPAADRLSEDEERLVSFTRRLEGAPFDPQAKAMRSWLIDWISASPDVSVTICNTLGLPADKQPLPNEGELLVQSMFGNAAWQVEHKGDHDDAAAQRAGVVSALRAYASMLRGQPGARIAHFDELLAHQAAGDLDAYLAPVIARECTATPAPTTEARDAGATSRR
jgi:tetratricopeptide (TPR) repeat protein